MELLIIILWIIFSFAVGMMGIPKKIGFLGVFFISLLLSPLVGLIVAFVAEDAPKGLPRMQNIPPHIIVRARADALVELPLHELIRLLHRENNRK